MNPDGLASALSKVIGYYNIQQRGHKLLRYGSIDNLKKRIDKAGEAEKPNQSSLSQSDIGCSDFQRSHEYGRPTV